MPTSPARLTASITTRTRPRRVDTRQINTGVPARLTQTKLAIAGQR
jgi:hypothetical protein